MRIYLPTDRIPVHVGEVKFLISPLSIGQKSALGQFIRMEAGEQVVDQKGYITHVMKCTVKAVVGVEDARGEKLELELTEDGSELTEEGYETLKEIAGADKIVGVALAMVTAVKDYPELEGVKIDLENVESVKKKRPAKEATSSNS